MDSKAYWIERYEKGGNSGAGSFGQLAQFKADFINEFVKAHEIKSVSEFGCGDGNQLKLYDFDDIFYTGYDVSEDALMKCNELFPEENKVFLETTWPFAYDADLTLSIDVIYHLLENDVFDSYMKDLFSSSKKYVIIYSTNNPDIPNTAKHIKHRAFTDWINKNAKEFKLIKTKVNKYPYRGDVKTGSSCWFFVFEKK